MAKLLGNVKLTIGNDVLTADHVTKMGAKHENRKSGQITIDKDHKLITAPCYMHDAAITDIEKETDLVVKGLIELA